MTQVWAGLVVNPETVSQRIKLLRDALNDDPGRPVTSPSCVVEAIA